MKIYKFGENTKPKILLLPGLFCHWQLQFGNAIPHFEKAYNVYAVSYTGFDETESDTFISMESECEKIESYIKENFDGHIHRILGESFGASMITLIAMRGNITFDHAILSSAMLEQVPSIFAKGKANKMADEIFECMQNDILPKPLETMLKKESDESKSQLINEWGKLFGVNTKDMSFVKRDSIYNMYYSYITTKLARKFFTKVGDVHILYPTNMGEVYNQRYYKHFANPDITKLEYDWEEIILTLPKPYTIIVRRITKNIK